MKDKDVGQSSKKKLKILSNLLKKNKIDLLFVSAAENIAWLLNIRGRDSDYSPIPNSYLFVNQKQNVYFFCKKGQIDENLKKKLGNNVILIDINYLKKFILKIKNKNIWTH